MMEKIVLNIPCFYCYETYVIYEGDKTKLKEAYLK